MSKTVKIPFKQVGDVGIIRDIAKDELPDGSDAKMVWTDGKNVRFNNGMVEKMYGTSTVLASCPVTPYSISTVNANGARYYLSAGLQKIYMHNGTTWTNVTRQTTGTDVNYGGTTDDLWISSVLNGIPILNNGIDPPQFLSPVNTSTKFQALTGWQSGYKAKTVRTFMNFIIAMDITKGTGVRYPNMIKWSDFASFGTIPVSWDEADPTTSAREAEIGDSDDFIVDCLPLGDVNIIYKNNSTWMMQLNAESQEVFHISKLFAGSGILAQRCACAIPNGHVVLTTNDVIFHNGSSYNSIISSANRKWLFKKIDNTKYTKCQVIHNSIFSEVWICFPESGSFYCTKALVWNYVENTWGVRDLPNTNEITPIQFSLATGNIDTLTNSINSYTQPVDSLTGGSAVLTLFNDSAPKIISVSPGTSTFNVFDSAVNTDAGTAIISNVSRENLWLGDLTTYKTVRTIYPRAEIVGASPTIDCYVGTSNQVGETVDWHGPYTFTANDYKIDIPFVSGRLISIKFMSTTDVAWKINGFDVEFVINGRY